MPCFGQRVTKGGYDQPARHRRFAEPHLGFGGMDVYIDTLWITVQKQRRRRMPVAVKEICVCPA